MAGMDHRKDLLLGIALLALGTMETLTGQSLAGYGKTANRADDPSKFWWIVAITYAGGLIFLGRYFYAGN
jgi:hypothetical protein